MVKQMRSAIVKVFSTKHSLTLPAPSLHYIEEVLIENEIPEDEWVVGLEFWAKEYLKAEDSSSLVSLQALKKAYENLQLGTTEDTQIPDPSEVNVESHFSVVDSFSMPAMRYDPVRSGFVQSKVPPSVAGQASSRSTFLRERWAIIKEIILRNENFTPPAIGGHDRANYLKLTSIRNLLGRAGQLFLLFGMLARNEEGKLCLEDGEGRVVLDMEDAVPGEGLFTEGCMVLIEGEYTVEETVHVLAMGHPPSERRDIARSLHGHVDFLGDGAVSLKEEQKYNSTVLANTQISFVILSDVWLDHPRTMPALRQMFEGYANTAEYRPMVFILCGNFCQGGWDGQEGLKRYTRGFNSLGELLQSIPLLHSSHFVFVPGPSDPWSSTTLPRPSLPSAFTTRLSNRIPNAKFVSNPCRLKYFGMEIVICREDLMGKMMRNLVVVKEGEDMNMKRYLVQTILDQAHLSPLPISVRPTLWEYDHALRLYPMPSAVVLADKYERYELTYEGCHVFNPGKFVGGIGEDGWEFEWSMYYPATGRSERSVLTME
ncbi:DNA polymerase epsilon subunit B [Cryptococcus deuterogattii 99/473]|uniref:DNA polymerase epsilon subunit n=2 Tax=Cryptococcus deuterogattii TaxID=1859096 RepID=A0A0D0UUR5_9TREE|nr:DNA polymerase epsilon subunit B [Cryptococcus deuterogattii R265]KIR28372.1 DNA polymerase epsilon subunit B [Cryptococcus deuterogattii LA55]KIR37849.1 DNA polymerase epsilon subunit B [Cryptococcus deuterogattii Ram5]KIR70148.1 DNA polymerase epsilon subunit B [Cryptococcus deuterogattii CA1014]KIR93855.1 DNA polymerase epsilon subunit B [Cryptococcus deuterogattii CBS 10090]KIY56729.1 DNA polymerase epsilon subunit B [Cryptococcus deuterogattii 99/473]